MRHGLRYGVAALLAVVFAGMTVLGAAENAALRAWAGPLPGGTRDRDDQTAETAGFGSESRSAGLR